MCLRQCGFWCKHDPSQSYIRWLIIPICLFWPKCADAYWQKCNLTPPFSPINSCVHVPPSCGLPQQEETDWLLSLYLPPVTPTSGPLHVRTAALGRHIHSLALLEWCRWRLDLKSVMTNDSYIADSSNPTWVCVHACVYGITFPPVSLPNVGGAHFIAENV